MQPRPAPPRLWPQPPPRAVLQFAEGGTDVAGHVVIDGEVREQLLQAIQQVGTGSRAALVQAAQVDA